MLVTASVCAVLSQEHTVELLYAPPGSDLVLAGTVQRQLVVWQYNPHAAHRYGPCAMRQKVHSYKAWHAEVSCPGCSSASGLQLPTVH